MSHPFPPGRRWAGLLLALACLSVAGCTAQPPAKSRSASTEANADVAPRRGGTLVVVQERPTTLDPLTGTDVYSSTIANQLFTGISVIGPAIVGRVADLTGRFDISWAGLATMLAAAAIGCATLRRPVRRAATLAAAASG